MQAAQGTKIDKIQDTLIGTLDKPGGMAATLNDAHERLNEHHERIKSLEGSRDMVMPVVAAHKNRNATVKLAKHTLVTAAVLAAWEWGKGYVTGKGQP